MTVPRSICLGFLTVITVGTLLLMLPISTASSSWNDPIVALFTATSAVCVTGHIVVDTATYFSVIGQVIILILIQLGGLGYMTATTFLLLLLGRRFGIRDKLALQQALDRSGLQGARQLLMSIIGLTLLFELSGAFLLMLIFVPTFGFPKGVWYALFHSISAWNNAGFSLFSNSLTGYQTSVPLNLIVTTLIIIGGIGYEVIFELYLSIRDRLSGKQMRMVRTLNFRVAVSTTVVLLLVGTLAFWAIESYNDATLKPLSFTGQLTAAWFQSVTTRTAGFNTIDIGQMSTAGLFLTIALMIVGGSPGGTAGGLKTTTVRVLASCTRSILQGKECVTMYERQVPFSLILKATGVTVASFLTFILGTMAVSITDPQEDFIRILFEVVSAFATVGLSTGITAGLSAAGKLVLVVTMYIGRVGILVLMSALVGDPRPSAIHYPEESLLVG